MASIVYQVDKKTGIKYAYESVSYWDKEKQQPRSKRTYIGKVDPDTGEIIPSRKKVAPLTVAVQDAQEIIKMRTILEDNKKRIAELEAELAQAKKLAAQQAARLREIAALAKS